MKDTSGRYLTQALFVEYADGKYPPKYTLKEQDDPVTGCPSLKRLYLEERDPFEARFAEKYFGSIRHWKRMCEAQWFRAYVDEWREELADSIASEAFEHIQRHAKKSAPAARWLAEKGWMGSDGKVSREELHRRRKQKREDDDFYAGIETRLKVGGEDDG